MAGGQEAIFTCSSATVDIEQLLTIEEDTKHHSQLVEGLAEDILGHGGGYQRRGSAVRFSQQQVWSWKLCGESKAGEGVHDQVDPEHLNSLQDKTSEERQGRLVGDITLSGLSCMAQAPMNATMTATTFTVSWNWRNLAILS